MRSPALRSSSKANMGIQWADYANLLWGVWLVSNPATLGYSSQALVKSDLICGALVIFFSVLCIYSKSNLFRWANCLIGIWLIFAPILFWAPSAAAYSNDTIFGCLIIACSAFYLGRSLYSDRLDETPPGWSYNPSSWQQRIPIIGLALIGFLSARYLAAYQLGHIDSVWDPFFGEGTTNILKSDVSKAFPVSDAGLGAFSYLIDALSGGIGDHRRWRTMPWMVILFGMMIIPPGITSITLVILQPVAVGSWCTICLFTAFVMLLMVPPAIDEVIASVQFLFQAKKSGQSFWKVLIKGDQPQHLAILAPSPVPAHSTQPRARRDENAGLNVPWAPLMSTLIGIWLMFAPAMLSMSKAFRGNTYVAAALVVTFAVTSFPGVGRPFRWILSLLGIWLFLSSFILSGATGLARLNNLLCGVVIFALSTIRGSVHQRYGSYDRWINWTPFRKRRGSRQNKSQAA